MSEKDLSCLSGERIYSDYRVFPGSSRFTRITKDMKKFIIIVTILVVSLPISAQFQGFFKPRQMIQFSRERADYEPTQWLARPTVGVSALAVYYNSELKRFETAGFNKVGAGIGYQHFRDDAEGAYNDYGFNFLILFDVVPTETTGLNITPALTVNAINFVNLGIAYDFGLKKPLVLTGLTYKF